MKKFYFVMLMAFGIAGSVLAQDPIVWDFEDWTAVPSEDPVLGTWRGGGAGSTVALSEEFPIGTEVFNFSGQVLKLNIPSDNGGLVWEKVAAFDRSQHNAVSFLVYAPGTADWAFEMMNSSSLNQTKLVVTTEETTVDDWYELIFEIPITVANDLTKFVIKPRNASAWGDFYIDDVTFFNYVKPAPTAISIMNEGELMVGKEETLKLEFTPQEEGGLVDQEATFSTSDAAVATVSSTGFVTAVSVGQADITVKSKADETVMQTLTYTITAIDPLKSYTVYDFEVNTDKPSTDNYVTEIVANPSKSGINTSEKVLQITAGGGAWAWMTLHPSVITDDVSKMTLKIYSETEIADFKVKFGVEGVAEVIFASLAAETWTEVTVDLKKFAGKENQIYLQGQGAWNSGTIYLDDVVMIAGDGAGYQAVTGIGALTGGEITTLGGTTTLAAPAVSPAEATNKEILWSIVSSEPADAATIDKYTGEVTALLNGEVTVRATTRDLGFSSEAVVTISGQGTGFDKVVSKAVSLSPNPARDIVYISDASNVKRVTVYNLVGSVVMESSIDRNQFDVGSLVKGLYVVVLTTQDNETIATKLMVE